LPRDIVYSVCPPDCPRSGALEVERIDGERLESRWRRDDAIYFA
jgi:hypothetical protein